MQLEVGLLENYCEVIGCPETGEAALIDPAFEVDRLLREASKRNWTVRSIFLTHTHDDHIAGLDEAAAATGATVYCHPVEVARARTLAPNVREVADREELTIGHGRVQALYTPGHTSGCICWHLPDIGAVITGDVLFAGSCGGLHDPSADAAAHFHSLTQVLGGLPEHTRVYPGHAYGGATTTTIAWELQHNPCMTAADLDAFRRLKAR